MTAGGRRAASPVAATLLLCVACLCLQHTARASPNVIRPAVDVEPGAKEKPADWGLSAAEQSAAAKKTALRSLDKDVLLAASSTGALLPACVPKYVTDLFIPPPMPVASGPIAEAMARRRVDTSAAGPSRRLQGYDDEEEEDRYAGRARADDRYEHSRYSPEEPEEQPGRYSRGALQPEFDVREVQEALSNIRYAGMPGGQAGGAPDEAIRLPTMAPSVRQVKKRRSLDDEYWSTVYPTGAPAAAKKEPVVATPEPAAAQPAEPTPSPVGAVEPAPVAENEQQQEQQQTAAPEQPAVAEQPVAAEQPSPASGDAPSSATSTYVGYDVSVKAIAQDVLPQAPLAPEALPGCPAFFKQTNVYAYGPANVPGTPFHNWPGFTIEAQRNVETRVRWTNDLLDSNGNFMPHMLKEALDQTLPWANPQALGGDTDISPCAACSAAGNGACAKDAACVAAATTTYNGPVPVVTHIHGQVDVADYSDGFPEAWYLPKARNMLGYKQAGSWHQTFKREYAAATGARWSQGTLTSVHRNTQRPASLWYHDNALGVSRLNKYAGLSGFYMVRDKFPSAANGPELEGLPHPAYDGVIDPAAVRELPLAIQDRAFTNDSQLWFPVSGIPDSEALPSGAAPPRWIPELVATVDALGVDSNMLMMAVNGRTWPRHTVYPDAYRLRILNACQTRTLQLRLARTLKPSIDPLKVSTATTLLPFYVVGGDTGFFPQMQTPVTTLEVGPGERFDVVVDFSGVMPSEYVYLLNNGPEPDTALYDGTNNGLGLTEHTAQIMRFDVQALPSDQTARPFTAEEQYKLNGAMLSQWAESVPPLTNTSVPVRRIALLSQKTAEGNPLAVSLGTVEADAVKPLAWTDAVATKALPSVTQFMDIINLSEEAHPIHLQGLNFRFIGRWEVTLDAEDPTKFVETNVPIQTPDLDTLLQVQCGGERCPMPKDTMIVLPKTRSRIAMIGPETPGLHLLQHEGTEMSLPFCIGTPSYTDPRRPGQLMCGASSPESA